MIMFICHGCREKRHDLCPGESWCDCQHRASKDQKACR